MSEKSKYSLWITPKGENGTQLQALVSKLAQQCEGPDFIPHITLAGHIYVVESELTEEKRKVDVLASKLGKFYVTLTKYGFMDEEHRCLYLLAESPELQAAYQTAATIFPQVETEHFTKMPHLSVLYGKYPEETKQEIIRANPIKPISFEVSSIDLFLTEGSANEWQKVHSAELLPPT